MPAVWPEVHVVPMMRTKITMISGIHCLSIVSCFVGLAGGVPVEFPSNSVCEGQVPLARALSRGGDGIARRLACCAVPVSQAGFRFKPPRRRGVLLRHLNVTDIDAGSRGAGQRRAWRRGWEHEVAGFGPQPVGPLVHSFFLDHLSR